MGKHDGNNQYGNAGDVCVYTKSNSHRTNRQSIGQTETVRKTTRIYNASTDKIAANTKTNNNSNIAKSGKIDINNYVESIKKTSTEKKEDYTKYDADYPSDTDTYGQVDNKNTQTPSKHQEDSDVYRLDVGHNDVEGFEKNIIKIKYDVEKSKIPIVTAIYAQKKTTGIRFTFCINNKILPKPFYSLYYNINREIYMGMIIKKENKETSQLSRTIEYGKLSFLDDYTIRFIVEDPNSNHYGIVQELHIDFSGFIDKRKVKKHSSLKQKLHNKSGSKKSMDNKECRSTKYYPEQTAHYSQKKNHEKDDSFEHQDKKPNNTNKIKIITLKKSKNFKC